MAVADDIRTTYETVRIRLDMKSPDTPIKVGWSILENATVDLEDEPVETPRTFDALTEARYKLVVDRAVEAEIEKDGLTWADSVHERRTAALQVHEFGQLLHWTLFPSTVGATKILGYIEKRLDERRGIRLALVFGHPDLERLPWELARPPDGAPWVLRPGVSIVRRNPEADNSPIQVGELPLRVLVVDEGAQRLRVNDMRYGKLGGSSLERMGLSWERDIAFRSPGAATPPLWNEVAKALRSQECDATVFHFTGHGEGGTEDEVSSLVFKAKSTESSPASSYVPGELIGGATIGRELRGPGTEGKIRLAVIAACHAGVDTDLHGFGAALVHYVPAVISMQAAVHNIAGDEFGRILYQLLREGASLDHAVGAARRNLTELENFSSMDWWLPVVHTNLDDVRFMPTVTLTTGSEPQYLTCAKSERPIWVRGNGGSSTVATWRPKAPVQGSAKLVASGSAGAVAVASPHGLVWVGVRNGDQDIAWWKPFECDPGVEVIAIHPTPFASTARLLLSSAKGTKIASVDTAGRGRVVRGGDAAARAGAWTGAGFTWVDTEGIPLTSEPSLPIPLPASGSLSFDAVCGRDSIRAAWLTDEGLYLCLVTGSRTDVRGPVPLHLPAEDVIVCRGEMDNPFLAFAVSGERLEGRYWLDIPPGDSR